MENKTIDLLPEFLDMLDYRLHEIYGDEPDKAGNITVFLELRKFAVCATAHIDAYYNYVLHCYDHIHRTHETTDLCPASVYNHNEEYQKIRKEDRFSKI